MTIKKLCARCNRIIDSGNTYCNECSTRVIKRRNKEYNTYIRDKELQSFYNSKQWKNTVSIIKQRDKGLCLMCLYNNKISYYNVIHHIEELKSNKAKALDPNNLICLCHRCHNEVHSNYNKNLNSKQLMQNILNKLIEG